MESERPDALFRDPFARAFAGERGAATARWWLIDLASPQLLEMLGKTWQPHLSAANAPMQFAAAEGMAFFEPLGWREAEFRSTWDESLRLRRSVPFARLWDLIGRLRGKAKYEASRRMSGVVLLERR
jgi:hypothetical protein